MKHVQRSYKLNETLDIELQEERKSNNEALVRCKDLHEQLQRPELPRRRIVRNFFYGGEEGAQIADLQGVDGGGAVMGRHEADEGESEVHDGVRVEAHGLEFVDLLSIPPQRAPYLDCALCY
nr:filament-like plant protein 4 [Ipomoea batatas]